MRNLFKKSSLKTAATFVGAAMLSASASAFDNIYIFGDSLSDTGNIGEQIGFPGLRFSNGPVAVDYITAAYGLTAVPFVLGGNNYAFGGATATGSETTFDTNLPIQINSYLASTGGVSDPSALYSVIIGGNDLFTAQAIRSASIPEESGPARQDIRKAAEARVTEAVASVEVQLMKLVATGAQHILVGNAPDVSQVPRTDLSAAQLALAVDDDQEATRLGKFEKYTSKLASQYNEELAAAVARVEALAGIDIVEWDMSSFLSNQIEDADASVDTDGTCPGNEYLPRDCTGYIFNDAVHPTTAVHQEAAAEVLGLLNQ